MKLKTKTIIMVFEVEFREPLSRHDAMLFAMKEARLIELDRRDHMDNTREKTEIKAIRVED